MPQTHPEIVRLVIRRLQRIASPGVPIGEDSELVTQLGLDSVKVLDLLMEIEDEFEVSVPMNLLADVRTVGDLARVIESVQSSAGAAP